MGFLRFLGNLIWFVISGFWCALYMFIVGLILCITIIGIPLGKQCFKVARLVIWPFGTNVSLNFGAHPIANVLWIIFGGIYMAAYSFILGAIFCVTIIGIPFGKQCFKMGKLYFAPFGAIVK